MYEQADTNMQVRAQVSVINTHALALWSMHGAFHMATIYLLSRAEIQSRAQILKT